MFNSSVRREAIEALKKTVANHEAVREKTTHASERLFEQRRRAAREVIERVETYVNLLANSPKEFDKTVVDYRIAAGRFDRHVKRLEIEAAQTSNVGSATGTAGALAVATTFGAASTGTAISALSGAAAANAALGDLCAEGVDAV